MNEDQNDYILGRNVSDMARATENRGTMVLSLRLIGEDFDALSDLAERQGKTISQVAREAVRIWLRNGERESYRAVVSFINGSSVSFGDPSDSTHWTGDPSPGNYESRVPVGT